MIVIVSACSDDAPVTSSIIVTPPDDYDPSGNVNSLQFKNVHSGLLLDSLNFPKIDTNATISFWVKIEDVPLDKYQSYEIVNITKPLTTNISSDQWIFRMNVNVFLGDTIFRVIAYGGRYSHLNEIKNNYRRNEWVHYAFVMDFSNESSSFYINGSIYSKNNFSTNDESSKSIRRRLWSYPNKSLMIGNFLGFQGFVGKISNFKIHNRALTGNEVAYLMNTKPVPGTNDFDNLVGYWDFNGTLLDRSGRGFLGTSWGTSFSTDVP